MLARAVENEAVVVDYTKQEVRRLVRIVRANAESVPTETARRLQKLADSVEFELQQIER